MTAAMKLKDIAPWKKSNDKPRQCIKKQTLLCQYSQSYGFSCSHVWMWEQDNKKDWVPNNLCLWTVVLEKTLESPMDCKEIKLVSPKRHQPLIFILEKEMATHSSILAWRIPWTEEPGGLQSLGLQKNQICLRDSTTTKNQLYFNKKRKCPRSKNKVKKEKRKFPRSERHECADWKDPLNRLCCCC